MGVNSNGTASVQLGSDASGPYLHVSATAAESTFVNSAQFTITPGSAYTLTITARISPDSIGSGYFALIFVAGTEVSRAHAALHARERIVGVCRPATMDRTRAPPPRTRQFRSDGRVRVAA